MPLCVCVNVCLCPCKCSLINVSYTIKTVPIIITTNADIYLVDIFSFNNTKAKNVPINGAIE